MKTLFSFLASLPLVLFAQKKLPFIESITSDTLKGKYQQIIFNYDQNNRVKNIIKTKCKTEKSSPNDPFPLIDTIEIQQFNYTKKNKNPISRKITQFEYDPVDQVSYWTFIQQQVLIYKEGKHIQDSIANKQNRLHLVEDNPANDKVYYWKGTFKFLNSSIKYILNFNYLTKRWGDYDRGETTELLINSQQNIEKDATEPFFKSHSSSNPPYFTYTKFDKGINPFSYLNISDIFPHQKNSFSFDGDQMIDDEFDEYLKSMGTDFNWYYFNKNNITSYTVTRGETDSPFKDSINLSYAYNQFNLPVQCFAEVSVGYNKDGGRTVSYNKKRFTFRYRN